MAATAGRETGAATRAGTSTGQREPDRRTSGYDTRSARVDHYQAAIARRSSGFGYREGFVGEPARARPAQRLSRRPRARAGRRTKASRVTNTLLRRRQTSQNVGNARSRCSSIAQLRRRPRRRSRRCGRPAGSAAPGRSPADGVLADAFSPTMVENELVGAVGVESPRHVDRCMARSLLRRSPRASLTVLILDSGLDRLLHGRAGPHAPRRHRAGPRCPLLRHQSRPLLRRDGLALRPRRQPLLAGAGRVRLHPVQLHPSERAELLGCPIGITNLVARATAGADELTADEIRAGRPALERKVRCYARAPWPSSASAPTASPSIGHARSSVARPRIWPGVDLGAAQHERVERALSGGRLRARLRGATRRAGGAASPLASRTGAAVGGGSGGPYGLDAASPGAPED